ncbi:MAG TPA: hypothetical protein DCS92_00720, partial [Gammaproteobacteria bacterium]|nr:hypothetical protein [Gammaproteobacteria bacterium]
MLELKKLVTMAVMAALSTVSLANDIISSHGIAMHGDMKYAKDFSHFEYTNPEAPKGGTATLAVAGTFDSFNPDIVKGDASAYVALTYDTLMV